MARQTAALICCHAASRGVVIEPALAKEIALDVHVDIVVPLGHRYVDTAVLNVRARPSEEAELLCQITEGLRVELWGRLDTQDEGIWGYVMWAGGEGWVSTDYLSTDSPAERLLVEKWAEVLSDGTALQAMNGTPPPEPSSEAFHAALEVDTSLSLVDWLRR